jgi:2-polyprenyl-3-methyl-5-hydroxy-6-metoxy-1,4-benzoquinol methylase
VAAARPLLDVGCGDGAFLDAARAEGWRARGLEIAVGAARGVAGRHPVAVGTLRALAPAAELGAVTFWDVLEHLPDPGAEVAEAAARLARGGVLAASMPNAAGTEAVLAGSAWRYHDLAAYGHLVHLGPRQLAALMTRAGLEVVHRETRGSVDLRDRAPAPPAPFGAPTRWLLDRASGVLARVAEPLLRGNTLIVVARRT